MSHHSHKPIYALSEPHNSYQIILDCQITKRARSDISYSQFISTTFHWCCPRVNIIGFPTFDYKAVKCFDMTFQDSSKETISIAALQQKLQALGADPSVLDHESADILTNPLDIYRSYLANDLTKILECGWQLIYDAIHWTNQLSNGDLILIVPKLRLKGAKPAEVTRELSGKV